VTITKDVIATLHRETIIPVVDRIISKLRCRFSEKKQPYEKPSLYFSLLSTQLLAWFTELLGMIMFRRCWRSSIGYEGLRG